jgi:predicted transcriptional regulator
MSRMKGNRRGHGELEAEVIAAVGAADRPATVLEVQRCVDSATSYSAVHTILNRLVDKGLVDREVAGRGHVYQPSRHAAGVLARLMGEMLDRGPSRSEVLRSFLGTLNDEDHALLRRWLEGHGLAPA